MSLEHSFSSVWIKGEISNLTKHGSGHWYFSLKDNDAQLGAVMFRGQNQSVRFDPTHGMEVSAHGRVSVYPPQGRYQLIIDQLIPAGMGDLHMAFEALKEKLAKEGLFDPDLKQKLPRYPSRIGIVTSATGAAIQDMLNILKRRYALADLLLLPVKVQGEGAAGEIAEAIQVLNTIDDVNVIIVGRGGGSLEDLWAFNEEVVARAISKSVTPVISAVGHETDVTISDFVADLRAPTPSAAAELVVPNGIELIEQLQKLAIRLKNEMIQKVQKYEERLNFLDKSYGLKRPGLLINELMQHLDNLEDQSLRSTAERLRHLDQTLDGINHRVEALNPLAILNRGYAVVSDLSGKVVKSTKHLAIDDTVSIRLSEGEIEAGVAKIKK
jgi:exodeoxyribonuclease VII large subunit